MNELEEKSNESWASKVVDYKKQQGGKYGRLHGVLSQVRK